MATASATPLAITGADDTWLVGATRSPALAAWRLDALEEAVALPPPGSADRRPRVSGLCVAGDEIAMATDWSATVEVRALADGALRRTLDPKAARVGAVRCTPEGWAVIAMPAVASDDPEAAGTGPGELVVFDASGAETARHTAPGGVVALGAGLAGLAVLAVLDGNGGLWQLADAKLTAVDAPKPPGEPNALAIAPDGQRYLGGSDGVCAVGGGCAELDGGAGWMAAGTDWVAVGGFGETTLLGADLSVRARIPGRPAGLYRLSDETLLMIHGREALRVDPSSGAITSRALLGEPG